MSEVLANPALVQVNAGVPAPVIVRSHLRLTRRGRVVFTTLAALPIIAGAFMLAVNGGGAVAGDASQQGTSFDYISVPPGESLWTLAVDLAPDSDPRDVIAAIIDLNQLDSSQVQAGQRLAIPASF